MNYLKQEIGEFDHGGMILLDVDTPRFVITNLVMISTLLSELDGKGLFISVDRPHQYMVHLMNMHDVDTSRITFIDAISQFSADRRQANVDVGYFKGPFNIDALPDMLGGEGGGDLARIDLSEYGFILIDNPATLLTYNPYPSVERFLMRISSDMAEAKRIMVPFLVDSGRSPLLFETIKYLSTQVVDVNEHLCPQRVHCREGEILQ